MAVTHLTPLLLAALCVALVGMVWWTWALHTRLCPPRRRRSSRPWRPRTPRDCTLCRAELLASPLPVVPARAPAPPWPEVKSRRGRPKRVSTQGYACPSPACPYHGITDAHIHAVIGYGHHGTTACIQDLRCQACGTKFSARRGTALYQLKTPPERVGEVLSALAEGLDVAAAVRVFGHGEATIMAWLTRAGRHASRLHERLLQGLHLPHVQLDEIRTRLRARGSVLWLWLAVDPLSKIVPVVVLGPRTQQTAHAVVHALRGVLASTCIPVITSDGLRLYFYAVTAHFGAWVSGRRPRWQVAAALLYGQVQKGYRQRRLVRIHYRVLCGTPNRFHATLQALGFSGRLTTAFIERLNLTVRQGVAALTRRTWSTAQTTSSLLLHVEWWRAYYHFIRPHQSLRVVLPQPRRRAGRRRPQRYQARTPAMAIGMTTHCWSAVEFLSQPCSGMA